MSDFLAAKDYLLQHGWIKGAAYEMTAGALEKNPPACVLGACWLLEIPNPAETLGEIAVEQFPERCTQYVYKTAIAQVNDHPETTLDDIVLILEKAQASQ